MRTDISKIIHRLRSYALTKNLKKSRLALDAGLDNKTLKDFWNESWNPTARTIKKLEELVPEGFIPAHSLTEINEEVKKRANSN